MIVSRLNWGLRKTIFVIQLLYYTIWHGLTLQGKYPLIVGWLVVFCNLIANLAIILYTLKYICGWRIRHNALDSNVVLVFARLWPVFGLRMVAIPSVWHRLHLLTWLTDLRWNLLGDRSAEFPLPIRRSKPLPPWHVHRLQFNQPNRRIPKYQNSVDLHPRWLP